MNEIQKILGKEIDTFKSTINDLLLLKRLFSLLNNSIDECVIELKEQNMIITTMDSTRIILINLIIYDIIEEPFNLKITIDTKDLLTLLKFFKQDTLDFELNHKTIKLKNSNKQFTLETLSMYEEDVPIDNLQKIQYDRSHKINRETLREIINEAKFFSEVLEIQYDETGLGFTSRGKKGIYERNEGLLKEEGQATYALPWLETMITGTKRLFKEPFLLEIKKDVPLHLKYDVSTFLFEAWLAPRVEEADYDDEIWEDED